MSKCKQNWWLIRNFLTVVFLAPLSLQFCHNNVFGNAKKNTRVAKVIFKHLSRYYPAKEIQSAKQLAKKFSRNEISLIALSHNYDSVCDTHVCDANTVSFPKDIYQLEFPQEYKEKEQIKVLHKHYMSLLEYNLTIRDNKITHVQLLHVVDLSSGKELAFQPFNHIKKRAQSLANRQKEHKEEHNVLYLMKSYLISDYVWQNFDQITYNLVNYLLTNEGIDVYKDIHFAEEIDAIAEKIDVPSYFIVGILQLSLIARQYLKLISSVSNFAMFEQEKLDKLNQIAYMVADKERVNGNFAAKTKTINAIVANEMNNQLKKIFPDVFNEENHDTTAANNDATPSHSPPQDHHSQDE